MQSSQLFTESAHRTARRRTQGEILEHDPGLAVIAAGADRARNARSACRGDLAQAFRFGLEHWQ
jgi:hypothetical protein